MKGRFEIMKYGDKVLLKTYKNGNKLWGTVTRCPKCDGSGKVIWTYADHVCFDCDGKGWYYYEEREYTPENLAKLEAKRAKEREKHEAEQAERDAYYARVREEEAKREAERLAEIERNRGSFIGKVGDKIQIDVTFVRKFNYESHFGWNTVYVTGYVFKTADGNTLVWKTSGNGLEREIEVPWDSTDIAWRDYDNHKAYTFEHLEEGQKMTIKGTIKAHEEYNNVNQTILNRAKRIA
jgi:hypothetical protein